MNQPHTQQDPARADEAALPHDRDEQPSSEHDDAQKDANRAPMRQARDDVETGVQDTERIGVRNDVPSSGDNARS